MIWRADNLHFFWPVGMEPENADFDPAVCTRVHVHHSGAAEKETGKSMKRT